MFNALLLSAGLSSRMGLIKQELRVEGIPILERSLNLLLSGPVRELILLYGPYHPSIQTQDERVSCIHNPEYLTGMGSSIKRGIHVLNEKDRPLLIHLSDKPLVKRKTLFQLVEYYQRESPKVLFPLFCEKRGHPVIFHEKLIPSLLSLKGRQGGQSVLESLEDEQIHTLSVDDPGVVLDVDTWEDYLSLISRYSI